MLSDLLDYLNKKVVLGTTEILKELNQDQFWTYLEICLHVIKDKMHLVELETILGTSGKNQDKKDKLQNKYQMMIGKDWIDGKWKNSPWEKPLKSL